MICNKLVSIIEIKEEIKYCQCSEIGMNNPLT